MESPTKSSKNKFAENPPPTDSRLDLVSMSTEEESESDFEGDLVLDSSVSRNKKKPQEEPSANFGNITVPNSSVESPIKSSNNKFAENPPPTDSRLDLVSTSTEEESDSDFDGDLVLDSSGSRNKKPQEVPSSNFGNITVANSSDIHIGNKSFYNGPVTIKQIVVNGDAARRKSESLPQGNGTNGFPPNSTNFNQEFSEDFIKQTVQPTWNQTVSKNDSQPNGNVKPPLSRHILQLVRRHKLLFISSVMLFIVLIVILAVALTFRKTFTSSGALIDDKIVPYISSNTDLSLPRLKDKELNVTLSGKLRLITRNNWLAQPPVDTIDKLNVPVNMVIIHHTATANCTTHVECIGMVRTIQMFHIETRKWSDIGYNFLVGGDGLAYEGRGWDQVGAHAYGYNSKSIGIGLVGTFMKELPPNRQTLACKQIIEWGVKIGKINPEYVLLGATQVTSTQSPGAAFFKELATWPHWKDSPPK